MPPFRILALLAFACFGLSRFLMLGLGGAGWLGATAQARIDFTLRSWLSPKERLSPKLKIFAYDDSTFDVLGRPELTVDEWGEVFVALAKRKPRAVIIDKQFRAMADRAATHQMATVMASSALRLYVGGAARPRQGQGRERLLRHLPADLGSLQPPPGLGHQSRPWWLAGPEYLPFGPDPSIARGAAGVGHINYGHVGRIRPLFPIVGGATLPHLALLASGDVEVQNGALWVAGAEVPLDGQGLIPVNFPDLVELERRTLSLRTLLGDALRHRPAGGVEEGDTVLILPLFYSGNVDVGQTPLGRIPRGFVLAAVLSSALARDWLRPLVLASVDVLILSVAGVMLGAGLSPITFLLSVASTVISVFVGAMVAFTWGNIQVPWFVALLILLVPALLAAAVRRVRESRLARSYEIALAGLVSPAQLTTILRSPARLDRRPREKILTVMFIDMVGFSKLVDRFAPAETFQLLQRTLQELTELVHAHSGVVDKTLGDGMLCFFGDHLHTAPVQAHHADQAIRCAVAIQRATLQRLLVAPEDPPVPLRIGINTARVMIGDLGNKDRIDFTLIGEGVNYAQRLEASCIPYTILLAEETLQQAAPHSLAGGSVREKWIRIKHHLQPVRAYQLDPFAAYAETDPESWAQVAAQLGGARRETRLPLSPTSTLFCSVAGVAARLINFSETGYCLSCDHPPSPGERCDIAFHGNGPENPFPPIACEVMWVTPERNTFWIGVRILEPDDTLSHQAYRYLLGAGSDQPDQA